MAPEFYFSVHKVLSLVTALDQTCPRHTIPLYCINNHLNTKSYKSHNYSIIPPVRIVIPSVQTMEFKTPERKEHKEMYPGMCLNNGMFNP